MPVPALIQVLHFNSENLVPLDFTQVNLKQRKWIRLEDSENQVNKAGEGGQRAPQAAVFTEPRLQTLHGMFCV